MEYRVLGKTGLKISRLGFGGIPIQRIDAEGTRKLVLQMKDAGVNYIDTARGYTVSEEYLGYALEGIREHFVIATKSMARTTEAKAAGKIGHIGVTLHAIDLLKQAVDFDWAETIMFPYNLVETQAEDLIRTCAERNIGFIVMKPLAGGAIEDASLALRYIAANPDVTVVIPGMAAEEELTQNIAAVCDPAPLSPEEQAKIQSIRDTLGTQFCRRCNYCAPCAVGIGIPSLFILEGYLTRYGLADWAKMRYDGTAVKASACIGCGVCETRCPYNLPIREMMQRVAKNFGE